MKLFPYYKRTITSPLKKEEVFENISKTIQYHITKNFPERNDFIGGKLTNNKFRIYKSAGTRRRAFPVIAYGSVAGDDRWTIKFTCNLFMAIQAIAIFGLMTFLTIKYETLFFTPVMIFYYLGGIIYFNKDLKILEGHIINELGL